MTPSAPPAGPRSTEAARRAGMADACVLILASRRMPATVTFADLIAMVGCTNREGVEAVTRFKDRARARQGLPPVATQNGRLQKRQARQAPGPAPDGMKWCGQGGHFVPRSEFSANATKPDGLQVMCRPCRSDYNRERRERRRAAQLEQVKP